MAARNPHPAASAAEIALAAQMACLLEVSAPKPGNVHRYRDFDDACFEDFLLSAAAIGPALGAAAETGVGETVLRAVRDTRRWVGTNTNLGILLLLAPLARAAALGGPSLRGALRGVLAGLTVADAEAVYSAIRLANPGGMGEVTEQDVRGAPTVPLGEAMRLAAERDTIAREYGTDFAVTFEIALPAVLEARGRGVGWADAATECFLATLASVPDTLIARKRGADAAAAVSREAARVLAAGEPGSPARRRATDRFDARLRDPGHALNPGTTADLTAAALFVAIVEPTHAVQE